MQSSDEESQELFNVPDDKLFNDGWVANATEWQWEDIALPKVDSGSIVKVLGEFDRFQGVVGLDNIRVYTKQKYVVYAFLKKIFFTNFVSISSCLILKI